MCQEQGLIVLVNVYNYMKNKFKPYLKKQQVTKLLADKPWVFRVKKKNTPKKGM